MTALFACDLDRTIIFSPRAFHLDGPDHEAPAIVVAELLDGAPISFMTRASEDRLDDVRRGAEFVPVTTRTQAQYERVRLPGPTPRHAVVSNGGVILVDGRRDREWEEAVRATVAGSAPLADVRALVDDPAAASWVLRSHVAEDLFTYAIVDRDAIPAGWLDEFAAANEALGWTVSLQGRKLYSVPSGITKSRAVAEVVRRTGAEEVLAAGDSLLDRPMLVAADRAFRPAHGELHDVAWTAPHVTVTRDRGIRAGEELLGLVAAALDAPGAAAAVGDTAGRAPAA